MLYHLFEYLKETYSNSLINLLKENFNPKAVSKLMGHAKEIITIDTYGDNKNIIASELNLRKRVVRYREYDNVNQAQLLVLCNLNGLTDFERKYVAIKIPFFISVYFRFLQQKYELYCEPQNIIFKIERCFSCLLVSEWAMQSKII